MSCWVHPKGTIDAIVQTALVHGLATIDEATELGRELWRTNNESFDYRYEGRYPEDLADVDSYVFTGVEAPLDPAIVRVLATSYRYQSCEHPGWEESRACKLTDALFEAIGDEADSVVSADVWGGVEDIKEAVAS